MNKDKVLDRVRKLLNLADNNPSVEEAAAAASMAQKLMREHAIEMSDLDVDTGDDPTVWDRDWGKNWWDSKSIVMWKRRLLHYLCYCNRCRFVFVTGTGHIELFGKKDDIQTVSYMFRYLTNAINALAKQHIACLSPFVDRGGRRAAGNSFRHGAVSEIGARLQEEKEAAMAGLSARHCTALVKVDTAASDKMHEVHADIRTSKGAWAVSDHRSFRRGREAASNISLSGGRGLPQSPERLSR